MLLEKSVLLLFPYYVFFLHVLEASQCEVLLAANLKASIKPLLSLLKEERCPPSLFLHKNEKGFLRKLVLLITSVGNNRSLSDDIPLFLAVANNMTNTFFSFNYKGNY